MTNKLQQRLLIWNMSQAGVSPKLIKQHANKLISTDDVNTRG